MGFAGASVVKKPPTKALNSGDASSIPRLGRSSRGGNGNPLQYSCQDWRPMDRGAWWATTHAVIKSQIQLSTPVRMIITSCFLPGVSVVFISSVQLLSRDQLFATPWTTARQVSLSITNSQSLLKHVH